MSAASESLAFVMDLGAVKSQVFANCSQALPDRYFAPPALSPGLAPHPEFVLHLTECPVTSVAMDTASGSIRELFMRRGAYIGAHVGPPVDLRWDEWKVCTLTGPSIATVAWHYFVKMALSLHAYRTASLHLKAACVAVGDRGIVIAGQGKTTLAMAMLHGIPASTFVTNTHLLVSGRLAQGVASNMRIRQHPDHSARGVTVPAKQQRADRTEDYAVPAALFGPNRIAKQTNVDLVLLRRDVEDPDLRVTQIDPGHYGAYWEQFLYALRCYDLEEDFFVDVFAKDFGAFERMIRRDRLQLDDLLHSVPVFEVAGSLDHEGNRRLLLDHVVRLT